MFDLVLNCIIAVLAVYVAALIFAIQHLADRYSPNLINIFLWRLGAWPLLGLLALSVGAGAARISTWQIATVIPLALFLATLVVGLGGSFWIWNSMVVDATIIAWLKRLSKRPIYQQTLDEVALKAIQRSDEAITSGVLKVGLDQAAFIQWLTDHRDLFNEEWLVRKLFDSVSDKNLKGANAQPVASFLTLLLGNALDEEASLRAETILNFILHLLEDGNAWSEGYGHLLGDVGFLLWNKGEPGAGIARTYTVPQKLEELQTFFLIRIRGVRAKIVESRNQDGLNNYYLVVGRLAEDTSDDTFISRIEDIVLNSDAETVFKEGLVSEDTLHGLACNLREIKRRYVHVDETNGTPQQGRNEDEIDWINRIVVHLGAMLAELESLPHVGGNTTEQNAVAHKASVPHLPKPKAARTKQAQSRKSELGRLLANGGLFRGSQATIKLYPVDWLNLASYRQVKQLLAEQNVSVILENRPRMKPITIGAISEML